MKNEFRLLLFLVGLIFISWAGYTQTSGCTDPNALNFDPDATQNDGSCIYEPTSFDPEIFIDELPAELNESSGLIIYDDAMWTHNDSGGDPVIYKLDMKSGEIKQTVRFLNAKNKDWEDIAQDDQYIYVADAGNNAGKRKEFQIYRIEKSTIDNKKEIEVEADVISYSYGDQTSFNFNPMSHNFDMEAMIVFQDSLYLFSKNWVDNKTKLYVLPKTVGDYKIFPRNESNVDGLITGASINPMNNLVVLSGYKDFESFVTLLFDFEGDNFLSGNKRKITFPELLVVQTEGVDFISDKEILISCEKSSVPPRIYLVNAGLWTEMKKYSYDPQEDFEVEIEHLDQDNKYIFIITKLPDDLLRFEIYDRRWIKKTSDDVKVKSEKNMVTLSFNYKNWDPGIYFVKLISGDKYTVRRIRIE